jgi:hypothetical protein
MTDADLSLLARQCERLQTDLAGLRDDCRALIAALLRLERNTALLLAEVRGFNSALDEYPSAR